MQKKIFLVFIFLYFFIHLISAQDLFRLLEDTLVWKSDFLDSLTDSSANIILNKDTVISNATAPVLSEINGSPCFVHTRIIFNNTRYTISANTFTAKDNEELFDEPFLSNPDPKANIWVNAYFLDAMFTGNRDVLMPYEQRLVDDCRDDGTEMQWHDLGFYFAHSLVVTQGTISIGGLIRDEFWVRQIKRIQNGYCVMVSWNTSSESYDRVLTLRSKKVNLPERNKDTFFYLYFILDGDYIDVYYLYDETGSQLTYCTSFACIDTEIRQQLEWVIQFKPNYQNLTDIYNPSRITFWPRRADGSMDYPPPEVSSNTSAQQTIDEPAATTNTVESQGNEITHNNSNSPSLPLWVWVAFIGGAVIVAGGVVFAVKRKK